MKIKSQNKVLIIAEAGVNHNGRVDIAKKLIDAAYECGADIVKFQTFDAEDVASDDAEMASYQKRNLGLIESQRKMLSQLTLTQDEFIALNNYCNDIGIQFLSTPFEIQSVRFLDGIQNMWKIPSGEITNYPYLVEVAKTGKDIILSTGMSTLGEVDEALDVLRENGAKKIFLLHCTTDYPAPFEEVNLNAMLTMRDHCRCPVGYSDHTKGIEVAIAAVAMGAKIIEKHFTLDRNMEGPDHKASLEPYELKAMVTAIRNIEKAMGDGEKKPSEVEKANIRIVRKSIVAAKDIYRGEIYTEQNLTTKRPGAGVNPMKWGQIIGMKAKRDFKADECIEI